MSNNGFKKGLLKSLRSVKKAERSLEKKVSASLRGKEAPKSKPEPPVYIHPWTEQNIGNPQVVDELQHLHCCGCGSCLNICPVNAITMVEDDEGFLYPSVDRNTCIECGKCIKHCPVCCEQPHNDSVENCYATMAADDEMRLKSSSGGLFSQLAEHVLSQQGVVFGAAYDKPDAVIMKGVTSPDDLDALRRAKYVQSSTEHTFSEVKELLAQGKLVMYSGCPCQIAGLYAFLGRDYENLITVDLVCHGSTSPGLLRRYLHEQYGDDAVSDINFRDKSAFGWSSSITVSLKDGTTVRNNNTHDPYCLMYHKCLAMRPFCSICKFTTIPRVADLSMGDFWGIEQFDPSLNDNKGTSLLMVNNEKGRSVFEAIRENMSRCEEYSLDQARPRNYTIDKPLKANPGRTRFFKLLKTQRFSKSVRYALNWHYDVGIYGLWYGENYGSMLTYYGLRKIIEDMGLSTVMVENPHIGKKGFTLEPHRFAYRQGYDITRRRGHGAMHELNDICDSFLLGSDQLWNPWLSKPYGFTYFLDFVNANNKRIAYGTSFGKDTHRIEEQYLQRSAFELHKFDAISVRDDFSKKLLFERYDGIDAQKVLDPAILCDASSFVELAGGAQPLKLTNGEVFDSDNEDFIFVYILDPDENTLQSLATIASNTGKKLLYALDYSPKSRQRRLDLLQGCEEQNIFILDVPSCEQWLRAIQDSACVLTDSFHGTIFSHVFDKDFVAVINQRRGPKRFTDLLAILGLENRMVDRYIGNEEEVCRMLSEPIDYEASNALLAEQQKLSMEWLREALFKPKDVRIDRAYYRNETPTV